MSRRSSRAPVALLCASLLAGALTRSPALQAQKRPVRAELERPADEGALLVRGAVVRVRVEERELLRGTYLHRDSATMYLLSTLAGGRLTWPPGSRVMMEVGNPSGDRWQAVAVPSIVAVQLLTSADRRWVVPGDTVRLSTGAYKYAGVLAGADEESLVIVSDAGGDTARIVRGSLTEAEVVRGRPRRGGRAVGRGLLVGAGVTGVLALALLADNGGGSDGLGVAFGATGGIASLLMGALGGGLLAALPAANWVVFDPATLMLVGVVVP